MNLRSMSLPHYVFEKQLHDQVATGKNYVRRPIATGHFYQARYVMANQQCKRLGVSIRDHLDHLPRRILCPTQ
jgi:hypothetical protein